MTIKKAYVDTEGGQVHYRFVPGDGMPLAFYHRTPASSLSFERMMTMMSGERPLYAFDTPGFGGSFDPPGMPRMHDYRDWMLQALDGLDIGALDIFAHHTGTHIATEMAVAEPHRVRSLMLNGIAYWSADQRRQFQEQLSGHLPPDPEGAYLKATWNIISGLFADFDPKLTHLEFTAAIRALDGRHQAHTALFSEDFTGAFKQIACPLLCMCAEDEMLRPWFQDALDAQPQAQSAILGPARYFSPELDTERTVQAVREFLKDVESG